MENVNKLAKFNNVYFSEFSMGTNSYQNSTIEKQKNQADICVILIYISGFDKYT